MRGGSADKGVPGTIGRAVSSMGPSPAPITGADVTGSADSPDSTEARLRAEVTEVTNEAAGLRLRIRELQEALDEARATANWAEVESEAAQNLADRARTEAKQIREEAEAAFHEAAYARAEFQAIQHRLLSTAEILQAVGVFGAVVDSGVWRQGSLDRPSTERRVRFGRSAARLV